MMETMEQRRQSLELELAELDKQKSEQQVTANAYSYYQEEDNLIKWQLDVNDILNNLYHLLKGDKIKIKDGNRIYEEVIVEQQPLSEEGVQDILREVHNYIQKNLLLSFYDAKQIDERVYQIGIILNDYMMDNYEKLGMDTEGKQERYELIVIAIVNNVDSAFKRALGGKERESLTKKTMVHQSLSPQQQYGQSQMKSNKSIWKPSTWFKS